MSSLEKRRNFLAGGAIAASGLLTGRLASGQEKDAGHSAHGGKKMPMPKGGDEKPTDDMKMGDMNMDDAEYPRMRPGIGGPVGSPSDRGKLVAGLRDVSLSPIPIAAPDLKTLPWEMVNGAKEFQLTAEPVRREPWPRPQRRLMRRTAAPGHISMAAVSARSFDRPYSMIDVS